jgi:hypothetical protein
MNVSEFYSTRIYSRIFSHLFIIHLFYSYVIKPHIYYIHYIYSYLNNNFDIFKT